MHKLAFGQAGMGEGGGGGTISAEGGQYPLADYVRGGHNPLADYVRGDKICGGTKSAPTPVALTLCKMLFRICLSCTRGFICIHMVHVHECIYRIHACR